MKPAVWLWRMLAHVIQIVARDDSDRRIIVTETTLQPQDAGVSRIPFGRIAVFGLLAIVLAIVVNYLLLTLVVNLLGLPEFGQLNPVLVVAMTAVGVLLATIAFAIISRSAKNPSKVFRTVALIALLVSFVPGILTMTGLVNVGQLLPFGGGPGAGGAFRAAGQNRQNGQNTGATPGAAQPRDVAPDAAAPGAAQPGQTRGQGQFRRNGQGFNAQRIPMQLSLMAMHLAAYAVTLGVFKRAAGDDE